MTIHAVNIMPQYFDAVKNGIKTSEIRKNDRDYRVGDILKIKEYDPEKIKCTNRYVSMIITHILTAEEFPDGIQEGYCILSLRAMK